MTTARTRFGAIRRSLLAAGVFVLLGAVLAGWYFWPRPSSAQLLQRARAELALGHLSDGERLAVQAAQTRPADPWASLVAAEAALRDERPEDALKHYQQAPAEPVEVAISAAFGRGEVLVHLGRLQAAELELKAALRLNPEFSQANYRLAFLLGITGRRWESIPYLLELIRSGTPTAENLVLLGDSERVFQERALLEAARADSPEDPLPVLGQARMEWALNQPKKARQLLEEVRVPLKDMVAWHALYGLVIASQGTPAEFATWNQHLPAGAEGHPDVWGARGEWYTRHDAPELAARCYWEAVRIDPDFRIANYRLGQSLAAIGRANDAQPFLERSELLGQLMSVVDGLYHQPNHLPSMASAAVLTEQLGRPWETIAWANLALQQQPNLRWAQQLVARIGPDLTARIQTEPIPGRTERHLNPALKVDLTSIALPDWSQLSPRPTVNGKSKVQTDPQLVASADVRFEDVTESAGLNFTYYNSPDPATPGARILETTGGGVAALDYDNDAWPDLYFTQGCPWPVNPQTDYRDVLYRQRVPGTYSAVSPQARLGDPDFSQGVSAGDFNNDGFCDLYVANIGQNRLYANNGDGTFTEITWPAGIQSSAWTTSCAMADLNGDGAPDLFDVNYCGGDQFGSLLCQQNGHSRSCSPRAFDSAPDQLWLSQGDGTFIDATSASGLAQDTGYGLGIVVADFQGRGRPNLFIANDEVPNGYLVNETAGPGKPLRFSEQGLLSGLSVDADGRAQACMGVAVGDMTGDGRLDLFITNFYHESNTLYVAESETTFADQTRVAGLRDPSFDLLGFGAQCLDADLDGWRDIVLTNGHIDDLTAQGEPYQMRPQFFRNTGSGRFVELAADQLGSFFAGKYLGRGLARLDWNRDGREDFVVSQIAAPAALLSNQTASPGNYLALRLVGRASSRDAIGATVRVTTSERDWMQQLTGGDGYQASNEHRLVFGLGPAETVEKVSIRWPAGGEQRWETLPANTDWIVIEGQPSPVSVPIPVR